MNKSQMRLLLKTDGVEFSVVRVATPKEDLDGRQKFETHASGLPMWTMDVLALEESDTERGALITVTVVAERKPEVRRHQLVEFDELEALPWSSLDAGNGRAPSIRSGVAYKARGVRVLAPSPVA